MTVPVCWIYMNFLVQIGLSVNLKNGKEKPRSQIVIKPFRGLQQAQQRIGILVHVMALSGVTPLYSEPTHRARQGSG